MNQTQIESIFKQIGGEFCRDATDLTKRVNGVKAFVFDWDGVFNNAIKNENKSSTFNEADSMGTNLLRYNHFFINEKLPFSAIISGEKNQMAFYFSEREHFDASYFKVAHKIQALNHFCETHGIRPEEVCYFFDDVLDLSIAEVVGLRIAIRRKANPLFLAYLAEHQLADYITGHESGNFAVREACELLIGLQGTFDKILIERTKYTDSYRSYITQRQAVITKFFTVQEEKIIDVEPESVIN